MIKYLGSKRRSIPAILDAVASTPGVRAVADLFSGSARVTHALRKAGYRVHANDINHYAHTLARCYAEADAHTHAPDAEKLIAEFNALPPRPGYFTETFCHESRFFHPRNGARIDAIRDAIADKSLPPVLEAVCLTALIEAADRVDSTTGVQMAYLKTYAPRARNALELRLPDLCPPSPHGPSTATRLDAREAAGCVEVDVVYIDPPYNQHSYLANYHIWETLVLWDRPEAYGVARKRADCRTRKSPFNSRRTAEGALAEVIGRLRAGTVVVSINDEGYIDRDAIEAMLSARGAVRAVSTEQRRYIGAQIGIHDPSGRRVGEVGRLRNTEHLLIGQADPASAGGGHLPDAYAAPTPST